MCRTADAGTALAYLGCIGARLPAVLSTRTLVPADEAMAGRPCSFSLWDRAAIHLDGSHFSGAREMYCRRVYFARLGFEIRPHDVVLDLGANAGLFTTLAAVYGKRVVAVEAQSGFWPLIEENLNRNHCRSRAALELALVGAGTGTLSEARARAEASHWGAEPARVSVAEIMEKHSLNRVNLMKVDIEGSEFDVFSGALGWLHAVERIVMEVHTEFGDGRALASALASSGYSVECVDGFTGRPTPSICGPSGYLFARR